MTTTNFLPTLILHSKDTFFLLIFNGFTSKITNADWSGVRFGMPLLPVANDGTIQFK